MDLIQDYDADSPESSSSSDANAIFRRTTVSTPQEGTTPKKMSSFEPIERIPIDRLMVATAAIAAQKPTKQRQKQTVQGPPPWIADIQNELRLCTGK